MSLRDIRERDALAVARVGRPDADPLLRAEMDRRYLLEHIDDLERELEGHRNRVRTGIRAIHRDSRPRVEMADVLDGLDGRGSE